MSITVVALLVMPTLAMPTASAQDSTTYYPAVADTFDSYYYYYLNGQGGWAQSPFQHPYYTLNYDAIAGRYVQSAPAPGYAPTTSYLRVPASYEGSMRIRLNSSLATESSAGVFLQSSDFNVAYYNASAYTFLGSQGNVYTWDASRGYVPVAKYAANEWVTIDIDFHEGGTYDVCVDGTPVYWDAKFPRYGKSGINTVGIYAGPSYYRSATARWNDVLYSPLPQDFCRADVGYEGAQDIFSFQGVSGTLSDVQIRDAAVDAFLECTVEAPQYNQRACPKSVADFEKDIRGAIADSPASRLNDAPVIESYNVTRATDIAQPTMVERDLVGPQPAVVDRGTGPAFPDADCCNPVPQAAPTLPLVPEAGILPGPAFPAPLRPTLVAGPALPAAPAVEYLTPPAPPAPVQVPTEAGPAFPPPLAVTADLLPCPECPAMPTLEAEPVVVARPDVPVREVVVPIRDHPITMNWSVSMDTDKLLDVLLPRIPPIPTPVPLPTTLTVEQPASAPAASPEPAPPIGTPALDQWLREREDLITYIEEQGTPELEVPDFRPPLVFEVHTESRNQTKRTLAMPFVPAVIDVDDNPTTGLLGFDVLVIVTVNTLLNEAKMNVTRLLPIERNMPPLSEAFPEEVQALFPEGPFPGAPLDLTVYALVPTTLLLPVETTVAQNPPELLVAAVGYSTQGNDAPASASLTLRADSLLPPHPNTRFEIGFETEHALDDFTLLGGFAGTELVGPPEEDLLDVLQRLGLPIPRPAESNDPAAVFMSRLINTTAHRLGYAYEANETFLATVAFQPTPDSLAVDLILDDDADSNIVVRLASEADTDTSVVMSEESGLRTATPVKDLSNLRADKLPRDITVTLHDDPGLPAVDVTYTADHALGRLEAIQATNVDLDAAPEDAGTKVLLEDGREGRADGVFHLNASDLPTTIEFRLENGTDPRLTAGAPIGRLAIVAADRATPALVETTDGLFAEFRDESSRFGATLRGLQGFRLVASEPVKVLRWDMVGDQPFRVNVSLGEPGASQDILATVSNLPPTFALQTDAASFLEIDAADGIRDLALYLSDATLGLEARVDLDGIPDTLDARFDLDAGELRLDASTPFRAVDAVARSAAGFGAGLAAIRLHAEDIPSFKAEWDLAGAAPTATFDAGDGIGLLEVQGGGTSFLKFPYETDQAYLLEGAHPEAPLALGARLTGLKFVHVAAADDSYALRVEHKRPQEFRVLLDAAGVTLQGVVDRVPAVVDVRAKIGATVEAVYSASEVIDKIFLCGTLGDFGSWVTVRNVPERVSLVLDPANGTAEWVSKGRLGSLEAHLSQTGGLAGTDFERGTFILQDFADVLRASYSEDSIVVDAPGAPIGLAAAALFDGPAAPFLSGLGVYAVETPQPGFPRGLSVRVPGFRHAELTTGDALDARLTLAAPTTVRVLHIGEMLGAPADVRLEMIDLPESVHVRVNGTTVDYEASAPIASLKASADLSAPDVDLRLDVREIPARVHVDLGSGGAGTGTINVTTSGVLRHLSVDARTDDAAGIAGSGFMRARASVRDVPAQLYGTWSDAGVAFDTGGDAIGLVEVAASATHDLVTVPGDHALFVAAGAGAPAPFAVPAGPVASARITGLKAAAFTSDGDRLSFRVDRNAPALFHALASLPADGLHAALVVDALPASLSFTTDMVTDHLYEASGIIRSIDATLALDANLVDLRLVDLPARVALALDAEGGGTKATLTTSSVLQSILVDARNPAGLLGTEFGRARALIERVPAQAEVTLDATGARFRAFDNALGLAEAQAARIGSPLVALEGDHALLLGDAAGNVVAVSGRITDLREASYSFDAEDGLRARLAKDAPAPFTGYVSLPAVPVEAFLSIEDVPATVDVTSDLRTFHLYEASSVIANLSAYAKTADLEGWLKVEDLPARLRVDVSSEGNGTRADFTASSRLRSLRADLHAPAGLFGTPVERAYVRVDDLPERITVDLRGQNFTFKANPEGVGLVEAAISDTADLTMLIGNHALFLTGCVSSGGLVREVPLVEPCLRASGRLTGLAEATVAMGSSIEGEDRLEALLDTSAPAVFTAYAFIPEESLEGTLVVDRLPAVLSVRSNLVDRHTYEASGVIDRLTLWAKVGTMEAHVDALLIPSRVDVLIADVDGAVQYTVLSQGRLGSLTGNVRDSAGLFGTPFRRAYARVAGVPEQLTVTVRDDGFAFRGAPGVVDLVEAAASATDNLLTMSGDHALVYGAEPSGIAAVSGRITGLRHAEATFGEEFTARLETEMAKPFTAHAHLPELNLVGHLEITDLPALVTVSSNLVDRHLYESSGIISRLDAYASLDGLQAWLGLEDVPARVKVLLNQTDGGTEAFILTTSRMQEVRADVYDPTGIMGTNFTRAYARVVGIPQVLSFKMTPTGAEFGTEHNEIALVEGAATTGTDLLMLEGDHLLAAELRDPKCERLVDGQTGETCPVVQHLSFRLHALSGVRATYKPDELRARLETKDARPFLVYAQQGNELRACLWIEPLPTIVDVYSDLKSEHRYDASSVIDKIQLSARVGTTDLFFEMIDMPTHVHAYHNATGDAGEVRVWMSGILREVTLDVQDYGGIQGSEFQRVRARVKDIPQQLEFTWDSEGAEFGTGWQAIGLIEAWASSDTILTDVPGDHARYQKACDDKLTFCSTEISGRITGLVGARLRMDDVTGLNARIETKDPRIFRAIYSDKVGTYERGATVIVNEKPAVLSFTSDLESRHIFESSGIVNTILMTVKDGTMTGVGVIENLPARMELEHTFDSTGGKVTFVASSHIGKIALEVRDPNGLQGQRWQRAAALIEDLPAYLSASFSEGEVRIVTDGQGIGLMQAGISTSNAIATVSGNGFQYYKNGLVERASARLAGFTGAYFKMTDKGVVDAELHLRDAAPFELMAYMDGAVVLATIDPVPEDVTLHIDAPKNIVYHASRPIEKIKLYAAIPTDVGSRTLSATLTTLPATVRFTMDEELKVIHLESSEPIGGLEMQVYDPTLEFDFRNLKAKIQHVPASVRVRLEEPFQVDLSEGVDLIEFGMSPGWSYPTYGGNHVSIVNETDGKMSVSARITGLKFVELASPDDFTLVEARFRESTGLRFHYENYAGTNSVQEEYDVRISNVPKEIKLTIIGDDKTGSVVYEASERIGSMDIEAISPDFEFIDLEFGNLPSEFVIEWKLGTDDLPWFARYIADAPADVHFFMPTDFGPLTIDATVQNLQWTLLDVPDVFPPDVGLELEIEWDCIPFTPICVPVPTLNLVFEWVFTMAIDTDFVPNNAYISLGLFKSQDLDVSLYVDGRIMVQDWMFQPTIQFEIEIVGTTPGAPGLEVEWPTVFGGGYAYICAGVKVRYKDIIDLDFCKDIGGVV